MVTSACKRADSIPGTLVFITTVILLCATPLLAMGPRGEKNLPPSPERKQLDDRLTIGKVIEDPSNYEGKEIVLEGIFRGWNGKCESSRPMTRSDWILEDETGCIYITGKIPPHLSPLAPKGERITVSGTVQAGPSGMPLVRAETVLDVPAMPER